MAKVLLERETVEGDAVDALLDNTWDEYLAGKEQEGSSAEATPSSTTHRRAPRMSEEELAADAAAYAQAAVEAEAAANDSQNDGASDEEATPKDSADC